MEFQSTKVKNTSECAIWVKSWELALHKCKLKGKIKKKKKNNRRRFFDESSLYTRRIESKSNDALSIKAQIVLMIRSLNYLFLLPYFNS